MNDEHLRKIAELLRETAAEIEALTCTMKTEPEETKAEVQEQTPEEKMLLTAAETGELAEEPAQAEPKTVEETRAVVAKALKAGLRTEAKAIISEYGSSVSEVGEKAPDKLGALYARIMELLEANNA